MSELIERGEHQRHADWPCGGVIAAGTQTCPECKVGRLVQSKRKIRLRDLVTRQTVTADRPYLKCRKCGCSFVTDSDIQHVDAEPLHAQT